MDVRLWRRTGMLVLCFALGIRGEAGYAQDKPDPQGWQSLASLPATFIEDLSFVTGQVGFAAAEGGLVLKTIDGGANWNAVLTLGYPYYWYGVQALSADDVVIAGFFDSNDGVQHAVVRWSHDGGASWSEDLVLSETYWAQRVHFWDYDTGFATAITGNPNLQFRTTSGGWQLSDWTTSVIDPHGGWFGRQFSALPNGHVRMSGITYCESLDYASTWNCGPSIDSVSDFATFFLDDQRGWVGGGVISIPTAGWVHRSTDGGTTWSGRTLNSPWQIREIIFVNAKDGWAAGGAGDAGGAYVSHDGGQSWQLELDAGVGLTSCATADYHLFCAGYDNSGTSHVYARDYDHIRREVFEADSLP